MTVNSQLLICYFLLLKQFALAIGNSHFRSLVDRIVDLPHIEGVSFGVASFPGCTAAQLARETEHLVVPHIPQVLIFIRFTIIVFLLFFSSYCSVLYLL